MSRPFGGQVEVDVRNSTEDWEVFTQPSPPKGSPNVVIILWDDTGIASWDFYGGLIKMPHMQRIADQGLKYTQFHTTALCSPTRASLLTGRNPSSVGMNTISEATMGFPGLSGHIPHEAAMISEVLQERGWSTFTAGKWHLTPPDEMSMASTKDHWPSNRGFDRNYSFLGGETNQWYPDLVLDNHSIDQPYPPEEGYHLSKDLVDQSIKMIGDAKQIAPDKPFFLYLTPGAGHAPHHVSKEWADKYKGVFDEGYEQYSKDTFERMKKMGLIPESTTLAPVNTMVDATNSVGMPLTYALPLAIFEGFVAEFIPAVGTYLGAAVPILLTLVVLGLVPALVLLVWVLIYQQVENYWLSPKLSAQTMTLNGGVAFGAALAGGAIAGPMGAFMALPVAALITSIISNTGKSYDVVYHGGYEPDDRATEPTNTPEVPTKKEHQ